MPKSTRPFSIRHATRSDALDLSRLLTLLGHPSTSEEILARWVQWQRQGNQTLVAVDTNGKLLALITLHTMLVLHRPKPVGRITSLVVDDSWRNLGIGKALVTAAETQLRELGCGLIEITSNDRLVDAHAFYVRLGYERTSIRLAKDIGTLPTSEIAH